MEREEELIMESDNDLPICSLITASFDGLQGLAVTLEHEDYEEPEYAYQVQATVGKEDVRLMAQNLGVSPPSLPSFLSSRFGNTSGTIAPSEAEAVFKEILDFILDCGARYHLKRT